MEWYHPKHKLPLYTRVTTPQQNSYKVGDEYEIRIEDSERASEKGEKPPYNYTHEAILVGEWSVKLSDVPNILLAFDANTKSRKDALKRIVPGNPPYPDDKNLVILTFLRKDTTKDFVVEGGDSIPDDFNKEMTES